MSHGTTFRGEVTLRSGEIELDENGLVRADSFRRVGRIMCVFDSAGPEDEIEVIATPDYERPADAGPFPVAFIPRSRERARWACRSTSVSTQSRFDIAALRRAKRGAK
jgi:hypothetical protein